MSRKTKKFGWFTGGGFEKDPFLTKEDKRYFRKKLGRKKGIFETFFGKKSKSKKSDWL